MRQHVLLAAFILLGFHTVHAETVSIANMDVSREAILLEAALTRFLRDDGYTVKGASPEGFVVLLHGMSAQTRQGGSVGVVGSATVIKVLRRESTAALLPEGYPQASEFVGTFTAVMGSLALGGGLLAIAMISPRSLGMGDVKLGGLIGLVMGALGWRYVAVAAFAAVLLGGVVGIVALAAGKGRKSAIPFGPSLAAGATVAALLAPQVASWYGTFLH